MNKIYPPSILEEGVFPSIKYGKKLPFNLFETKFVEYGFFERSCVSIRNLLETVFTASFVNYSNDIFVSLGESNGVGTLPVGRSFIKINKNEYLEQVALVRGIYLDFDKGALQGPVIIQSKLGEWALFEDPLEDIGVIGFSGESRRMQKFMFEADGGNFFYCTELQELLKTGVPKYWSGKFLLALQQNYCMTGGNVSACVPN